LGPNKKHRFWIQAKLTKHNINFKSITKNDTRQIETQGSKGRASKIGSQKLHQKSFAKVCTFSIRDKDIRHGRKPQSKICTAIRHHFRIEPDMTRNIGVTEPRSRTRRHNWLLREELGPWQLTTKDKRIPSLNKCIFGLAIG